jgi:uncharacterized membrane protein
MKRKIDGLDLLAFGLLGASAIATAAVFERLPDPMPTHYDLHGVPNGWMPRPIGAFIVPVLGVGVWALIRFGGGLLPKESRERLSRSPMSAVGAIIGGLMAGLQALMLQAALATPPRLGGAMWLVAGAFSALLGLVLPRVRRNPWVGVRTPWSLASDENWARTHRFAGYTMTVGGALSMIAALLGSTPVAVTLVVAGLLSPVFYSWYVAKTA